MAVVMLSENCRCNGYADMVNNSNPGAFCGCMVAEAPLLSNLWDDFGATWKRTFSGTKSGWCPACHRVVDNLGDTVVNLTGFAENIPGYADYLTGSAVGAAGNIIQGAGQGVGGFLANPQNIPCVAGAVAAAYGMPLGLGGCVPAGHNEQFSTMPPPETGIDPLLLYGGAALALILLMKK